MADVKVKLREAIGKTFTIASGQKHNFEFILPQVFVLDVEDSHFNHNRSILLPDLTSVDKSAPVLDARRVTGLGVLFAALVHGKDNPAQGLFVTGHTDASGGAAYNQTLSEERAKNVSLLLRGKRDDWRKQAAKDDAVDDYQTILKWQSMRAGWETDPGPINNKLNAQTKKAIGEFQRRYTEEAANAKAGSPLLGKPALVKPGQQPDQVVGKDTWGAFYDIYMEDLMDLLELTDVAQLESMQGAFKPPSGMTDFVGCGEHMPHNPARRDPFVKQKDELDGPQKNPPDRRVEILFFDPGEEVNLVCHPKPGQCIPAECPVYIKGPHQQVPIGIPKGLNVAEVNLKLTFVDPEGKVRPFPAGLEVEAKFGDPVNEANFEDDGILDDDDSAGAAGADASGGGAGGGSASAAPDAPPDPGADPDAESMEVDQEPNEKTGPGGLLRFVIPRKASKLFLRILAGADQRFITADPKNLEDQQLATLPEAFEAVGKGRVFFQLPTVFNTRQGYFKGPDGIAFKDGQFLNIDNRQTQIGSRGAPAELRLEIHWQHFKFEYFDRFTSSPTTVPQPRSKTPDGKDVPALDLQGFQKIPDPPASPFFPLARSSWDLKVGKDTVHCLAWVRRDLPEGNPARELPDEKCLTTLRATNTFVRTEGDGKSPDSPRQFVTFTPGASELTTPGVDRLRLYDLPNEWWSANYPARLGGEGVDKIRPFEQLATTKSAPDKPYVVSLDTIVLDDGTGSASQDVKFDDSKVENRFTIYDNSLTVYKADSGGGEPYFTRLDSLTPPQKAPILTDHPPFTRLIARGVSLLDVFDRRTTREPENKGFPIGARLAAINPGAMTLFAQPYRAPRPNSTTGSFPDLGNSIGGFLRCCGRDGTIELFNICQYVCVNFDFAPKAPPDLPKGAALLTSLPGDREDQVKKCLINVAKRWTGGDGTNPDRTTFEIGKPITARGSYTALMTRGLRSANGNPQGGEIQINIYRNGHRAFMRGPVGHWALEDMKVDGGGHFTAAHEFGHVFSLPDEYLNTDDEPSLKMPNIGESARAAGNPYGFDENAMMVGNIRVRARYFWDLLLFARARNHFSTATEFALRHGSKRFSAEITPPNQSRVRFPAQQTPAGGAAAGALGLCDQFLYATGQDEWLSGVLPDSAVTPFDGFIIVRVKMGWTFGTTSDFSTMKGLLTRASNAINQRFNRSRRLVVRGLFKGSNVRLRVIFAPKFVSHTFPTGAGASEYLGTIDNPAITTPANANTHDARVTSSINAFGVHVEIAVRSSGSSGVVSGTAPRKALVRTDGAFLLVFTDSRFDDDVLRVFAQMVGLPDDSADTADAFLPLLSALSSPPTFVMTGRDLLR